MRRGTIAGCWGCWTVLILALLIAPGAQGQTINRVSLGESDSFEDGQFTETFFVAEVEGTGISSVGIVTPGGFVAPLFEDEPGIYVTEVPFFAIAEREAIFPNGTYELFVNGVSQGSASFAGVTPNGLVSISAPDHLSAVPSQTPTFAFSNSCTNCTEPIDLFLVQLNNDDIEQDGTVAQSSTSFSFPAPLANQQLHLFEASALRVVGQQIGSTAFFQTTEVSNGIQIAPGATGQWTGICGDLSGNLILESSEIQQLRDALADPIGAALSAFERARCAVIGSDDCDVRQLAVMLRTFADRDSEPGFAPVCSAAPASAVGTYTGTIGETATGCLDPSDDGFITTGITINLTSQDNFGVFQGSATATEAGFTLDIFVQGTIDGSGSVVGQTLTNITFNGGFDGLALADFTGTLVGNTLSVNTVGVDLVGDICEVEDAITASR